MCIRDRTKSGQADCRKGDADQRCGGPVSIWSHRHDGSPRREAYIAVMIHAAEGFRRSQRRGSLTCRVGKGALRAVPTRRFAARMKAGVYGGRLVIAEPFRVGTARKSAFAHPTFHRRHRKRGGHEARPRRSIAAIVRRGGSADRRAVPASTGCERERHVARRVAGLHPHQHGVLAGFLDVYKRQSLSSS